MEKEVKIHEQQFNLVMNNNCNMTIGHGCLEN